MTYRINLYNDQMTKRTEIGTADTIEAAKALAVAYFAQRGQSVFEFFADEDGFDAVDFLAGASNGVTFIQGEVVAA